MTSDRPPGVSVGTICKKPASGIQHARLSCCQLQCSHAMLLTVQGTEVFWDQAQVGTQMCAMQHVRKGNRNKWGKAAVNQTHGSASNLLH